MLDIELSDIINVLGQPTKKPDTSIIFSARLCKSRATRSIISEYPFFKDKRSLLRGCKDINEYLCQKRAGNYQ